jgi:hypothetical protein
MRYLWRTLGGADQIERGGQALLALFRNWSVVNFAQTTNNGDIFF